MWPTWHFIGFVMSWLQCVFALEKVLFCDMIRLPDSKNLLRLHGYRLNDLHYGHLYTGLEIKWVYDNSEAGFVHFPLKQIVIFSGAVSLR